MKTEYYIIITMSARERERFYYDHILYYYYFCTVESDEVPTGLANQGITGTCIIKSLQYIPILIYINYKYT